MRIRKYFIFIFSILLFSFFVYFSYVVHVGIFNQFDFDTTVKFQNHISRKFDFPFSVLSLAGSVEITGTIWFLFFIYSLIKKYFWLSFGLPLFWVGLTIELFGKTFLYHPSPPFMFFRGIGFNFPITYVSSYGSYPSGHVYRSAFLLILVVIFLYFRKIRNGLYFGTLSLLFLILMMASRIYLGEHWTTDVLGGMLLGSSIALFCGLFIPNKKLPHECQEMK